MADNAEHDVSHWEQGWHHLENQAEESRAVLHNLLQSAHWRGIKRYLEGQYGSLNGLRVIEVGCGRGVTSAAMATEGAEVTLVDLSESALRSAEEFFGNNGLAPAACVAADVFALPAALGSRFDVAVSFGLVEHFQGQERLDVFMAHLDTLRAGGSVVISAPNRLYLPAQMYQFVAKRTGTWPYGFERDFTPRELLSHARLAGVEGPKIIGSEVLYDLYNHTFRKLPAFARHLLRRGHEGPVAAEYDMVGGYTLHIHRKQSSWPSPLDSTFGFSLVLLGQKPASSDMTA